MQGEEVITVAVANVEKILEKEYMELREKAETYGELRRSIEDVYKNDIWYGKNALASIRRDFYKESLQKELDNMKIAPL